MYRILFRTRVGVSARGVSARWQITFHYNNDKVLNFRQIVTGKYCTGFDNVVLVTVWLLVLAFFWSGFKASIALTF